MNQNDNTKRVLVVGAGVAGSAAAVLLGRAGHEVTVVERSAELRTSGSPVDLRGGALAAMAGMGLLDEARRHDTGVRSVSFLGAAGQLRARAVTRSPLSDEVEISRNALGGILLGAAREVAEVVMGDSPASIEVEGEVEGEGEGVGFGDRAATVTFDSGARRRYDLVIGADGQHSTVRRLIWGPEERFSSDFGVTIATAPIPAEAVRDAGTLEIFNEPGRSVAIHPAGGKPVVAFIFRDARPPRLRDRASRFEHLQEVYRGGAWRTDELLAFAAQAGDLYYDTVTRIRVPAWSRGPVVLLGDAAGSLTILGEGSSMALIGATRLATALQHPTGLAAALAAYESAHRPLVESKQRGARAGVAALVPANALGLTLRNLLVRLTKRI